MVEPSDMYQSMVQFLTTEHFTLQTARSTTISESNGRASLFLGSVSSGVVALALVAQVSEVGPAFFGFAAILLPILFFLGLTTQARLVTSSAEYWIYSRAINRVRSFYVDAVPDVAKYLALAPHDDFWSTISSHAIRRSKLQVFVTLPGAIAVITAVIGGVFLGLLVELLLRPPALQGGAVGIVGFVLIAASLLMHQRKSFLALATAEFPTNDPVAQDKASD